jgi:predicted neuraminidase
MFSAAEAARDCTAALSFNRLLRTPLQLGTWALLQPAGPQNHAPQLCWLSADLLGCVWMAGGQEGTAGMGIMLATLKRGAGRWSVPRLISQDGGRSEQNPLLFLADNQGTPRLQLVHTAQRVRQPGDTPEAGEAFSMQWTASLRMQQRGPTGGRWSRAIDLIDTPAFCRHPPLRRSDGRWLLPIYRSLETGGAFGHDHSEVLVLEADGTATTELVQVPNSIGRVHGSIVPSADGRALLQFFRSRQADRIYRAVGSLDGVQWTEPLPTDLPNNNSSIQALRLQSGRLVMIFNRFSLQHEPVEPWAWGEAQWPRTRWPLSVALSDDDGESWPWIRDLDHGLGFAGDANWYLNGQLAYPTILEGLPGELHIAYSWAGRQAIRYVCLHEHQILGLPG